MLLRHDRKLKRWGRGGGGGGDTRTEKSYVNTPMQVADSTVIACTGKYLGSEEESMCMC